MMNDEDREKLSAYIDGALPDAERLELEARLRASAELRRELDELRASVSAVKDLPRESLPPGFMTRFAARRARGDAPRQDWVFLPPAARPLVAAMSCGVVALMVWDKVVRRPDEIPPIPAPSAKVAAPESAPVSQVNLSALTAQGAGSAGAAADAKSLAIAPATNAVGNNENLPFIADKDVSEKKAEASFGRLAAARGGRAPGKPFEADSAAVATVRGSMSEEERSARNEELFKGLEKQKSRMGIAKVLPKPDELESLNDQLARATQRPAAPTLAAPAPTMLKRAESSGPAAAAAGAAVAESEPAAGPGRLSPDGGLVFADARSLSASWVLLGFSGLPPTVDFSGGDRVVLIKPSSTKIVSAAPTVNSVTVVYRSLRPDEDSDPAKDRVAIIPAEPKTVLIFDATPQ